MSCLDPRSARSDLRQECGRRDLSLCTLRAPPASCLAFDACLDDSRIDHAAKHNAINGLDRRHSISGVLKPALSIDPCHFTNLFLLRTFVDVALSTASRNLLVHVTGVLALFAHSLGVAVRVHALFRGLWVLRFRS